MSIQRARILAGLLDAVCEYGVAQVSVADITGRCGVSRRTFYELFDSREGCFIAAFNDALALATARVSAAASAHEQWVRKLRAGVSELLRFCDEEPQLARLVVCESLLAGSAANERRDQVVKEAAGFLHEGRHERKTAAALPLLQAEGSIGGAVSILHRQLLAKHDEPCSQLAGPLTAMLVMPYLGQRAATRELERPVSPFDPPAANHTSPVDPLKHAGLRLTYRTVRVLVAIADLGGTGTDPSNRQVGHAAGILDQGQVSKLLSRLGRAGMIENTPPPGQGAPNAWRLTDTGRQLTATVRAHTNSAGEGEPAR